MGPRSAALGGGDARGRCPQGPSVELFMWPRNGVLYGGDACGLCHRRLRGNFLWVHETVY
eukprot:965987-Pyramimonas_sp.AAC.1